MKNIFLVTLISLGLISCSNEELGLNDHSAEISANAQYSLKKGNPNSNSSYTDYNVHVGVSADGTLWTYNITRSKPNAKNLSHFIIDLGNCGDESASFANIIYATVNGAPANLVPTEGSGTGCDPQATTTNFVKVNTEAATSWVIVIKFDRGYASAEADSWIKAGTSCNSAKSTAPGCPIEDYCSFSQGFFFANGALQNGASASWVNGLTIGGVTYTQAQGMTIWSVDRGPGGNQVLNAFFQLGAVRLSGVDSEVQTQADIIDAYFTAVGNVFDHLVTVNGKTYFNLPTNGGGYTVAQVIAAGSAIATFVDENHCD
ncbi:hypothetical protein NA63_2451 [Flavobacteriaceae bacterium MAR_2010_105]|nr:hypothetical protein NA63_2451 [Flavobacteriaceae bacterium MAR_2010_105]